ncbi:MAG: PEP-utilizing enzyme, partial [Candidatus Diapherotrites archaeon]
GLVKGKVKVVNHPNEMHKMNQGDIMVSHSTNPNLVPAMKKAGAIITDVGGITCHAAIVSRELNIPCVIGTKSATKILKDGEKVEVNATKGIIKRIKK